MVKKEIWIVLLLGASVAISGCASPQEQKISTAALDSFAQCITENGVKMYGSYICSACLAQIKMFGGHGGSFRYIDYIECHPRGINPQTELCLKRDINKTPTWILEKEGTEIKRLEGLQTFETLSEFSGCSLG